MSDPCSESLSELFGTCSALRSPYSALPVGNWGLWLFSFVLNLTLLLSLGGGMYLFGILSVALTGSKACVPLCMGNVGLLSGSLYDLAMFCLPLLVTIGRWWTGTPGVPIMFEDLSCDVCGADVAMENGRFSNVVPGYDTTNLSGFKLVCGSLVPGGGK